MRERWLARTLAGWLAVSGVSSAAEREDAPGTARVVVAADGSPAPAGPPDRPTELPPFIAPPPSQDAKRPPSQDAKRPPAPKAIPPRKGPSDYNPAYNYLPDQNPGTRQPPCPCLPVGRVWVTPSYFLGTTSNDGVPPLVSGARPGGHSATLFGDNRLDHGFRSGMRLDFGTWLDRCQTWGFEGHFTFIESSLTHYQAQSTDDLTVARPFVLPDGSHSALVLGGPGSGQGSVAVSSPLMFLAAEANTRKNLFCEDDRRVDFIAGYRFVRLAESVHIASSRTPADGGTPVLSEDDFRTGNQFHGGQVGLSGEYRLNRWYVSATAKVAFGLDWERLTINGATRAGAAPVEAAGLLARPSNSGETRDARFAVVPEGDLAVGYQVTDQCRAFVGYTFLYLSSAARPGQAIDPIIDPTQPRPGTPITATHPLRQNPETDFWFQGINLGVELRY